MAPMQRRSLRPGMPPIRAETFSSKFLEIASLRANNAAVEEKFAANAV
jgi:hypothetical protein